MTNASAALPSQSPVEEPLKMYSLVRDRAGDIWERGRTRWTCTAPVDGRRILRVARLYWSSLSSMYGPVQVVRGGKTGTVASEERSGR